MCLRYLPLLALAVAPAVTAQTYLLDDRLAYAVGMLAGQGGWAAYSDAGSNAVAVQAENVDFLPEYATAPGGSVLLIGGSGAREDVAHTFAQVDSGSVYVSAVVRVSQVAASHDYVLMIGTSPTGTVWRNRVGLRAQDDGFVFTFSKGYAGSNNEYLLAETTKRALDRPYLVTLKYTIVDGTSNDEAALFVQSLTSNIIAEPRTPTLAVDVATELATDIKPGSVALRQGGASHTLAVDGLRVSTTWPGAAATAIEDEHPSNTRLAVYGRTVQVTATGVVNVALIDLLGRHVATLFAGTATGTAEALLPDGLTPGVYVVRAVGDGLAAAQTVVVR